MAISQIDTEVRPRYQKSSWRDTEARVEEEINNFQALWDNNTPGLHVVEFSEVGKELLDRFRDPANPPDGMLVNFVSESPRIGEFSIPRNLELRSYQKEAIRAWIAAGGKGIFAMATGSGKTFTALTLACKVAEKNSPFVLIIICPFINLCQQWIRELAGFGLSAVPCFQGFNRWEGLLEEGYQKISVGLSNTHAIVTTNSTFVSKNFQSRISSRLSSSSFHHLLIADEVHNLGAEKIRKVLPKEIVMRLGLSATPDRYLDPVGTGAVLEYFGQPVYEYPISQAIADGHLCRYRYYPVLVQLTEEESEEYLDLTTKLAKFFPNGDIEDEMQQLAMHLLIKRARLLAGAKQKITKLNELIESLPNLPKKAIFYCGDGRTTDIIQDDEVRQIKAVSRLLGTKHGMKIRNFTSREKSQDREEILRDFGSGFLDGIVAIRCLDEGIDLPDLRMGFLLASSTNPRQFIQRRGRLLRNAPGKDRADIYDFIIEPPDLGGDIDDDAFNLERSFFQRELKRIVEFCRTAENGPTALNSLKTLRINYNLLSE